MEMLDENPIIEGWKRDIERRINPPPIQFLDAVFKANPIVSHSILTTIERIAKKRGSATKTERAR